MYQLADIVHEKPYDYSCGIFGFIRLREPQLAKFINKEQIEKRLMTRDEVWVELDSKGNLINFITFDMLI